MYDGKIYVVGRQALDSLVKKLPVNGQNIGRLTIPERGVLDTLHDSGEIALFGEEWRISS